MVNGFVQDYHEDCKDRLMQGISLCNHVVFDWYDDEKRILKNLADFVAMIHGSFITYSLHLAKYRMGELPGIWADDSSDDEVDNNRWKRRRITNDRSVGMELRYTTKRHVLDFDNGDGISEGYNL